MAQLFGIVASIILARALGPAGRGTITTLTVWGQLIGWFFCLSLDKAFMVLERQPGMTTSGTFGLALKIGHGATAPAAIAALILGRILLDEWTFAASLAVMAVASLYYELISAWFLVTNLKCFALFRLAQPVLYLATACASAAIVQDLETRNFGALWVPHAHSSCRSSWQVGFSRQTPARDRRPASTSLRLSSQAGAMLQYLNNRLDLLYLATFGTRANLGVYAVGASIGQATLFLGSAGIIRGVLGRHAKFDWSGVALIALAAGVLWGVCPVAVPLAFGDGFKDAIDVARFLLIGAVINFALQNLTGRLLGNGRPVAVAMANGAGVPVFGLGVWLSATLRGVALASVLSYAVSLIIALCFTVRGPRPRHSDAVR